MGRSNEMLKKNIVRPCAVRWSFLEGLQRLVLPGRPLKAGPSWNAFKGWSFLEGLQRLVLPGRPSKAGPSWKAFKGWSFLEGLQRLVLPGSPSKADPPWKAFKGWSFLEGLHIRTFASSSTFTSFFTVSTGGFPSSSSRNRIFFAPLPQQARVPPKRERKRKYVTPARKVFCFQSL